MRRSMVRVRKARLAHSRYPSHGVYRAFCAHPTCLELAQWVEHQPRELGAPVRIRHSFDRLDCKSGNTAHNRAAVVTTANRHTGRPFPARSGSVASASRQRLRRPGRERAATAQPVEGAGATFVVPAARRSGASSAPRAARPALTSGCAAGWARVASDRPAPSIRSTLWERTHFSRSPRSRRVEKRRT